MQLTGKTKELRTAQSMSNSLEKDLAAVDANYKVLAQSHSLLVVELVRHLTCLRSLSGKQLDQSTLAQMIAQLVQRLPAKEVQLCLGKGTG